MEWIIMNCDDLKGLCGSIGATVEGEYQAADDCLDTLQSLLESLKDEDPVDRSSRRQLAASHVIQQDLLPLLTSIEDDPEVFHLGVRLLVNMTQPVECLQQSKGLESTGQQEAPPWAWDVNSMLIEAKTGCSDVQFIKAVFNEIQKILEDAGEYDLVEVDCDSINQCLLLIRNLLYIQDTSQSQDCIAGIHLLFLKNLFQCGVDKVLLFLLNTRQKDFWGVTLIQLLSLLYRDLVSEIFMRIEDFSSCGEESCDSSNCSHCEAAMDRPFPFQPSYPSGLTKQESSHSSGNVSPDFTRETASCTTETKTMVLSEQNISECNSSPPLSACFRHSCQIDRDASGGQNEQKSATKCSGQCDENEGNNNAQQELLGCLSTSTLKSAAERLNCENAYGDGKSTDSTSSLDELGSRLTEFTFDFLQNGFSSLVNVLKRSLMSPIDDEAHQTLDESYFLWSVAFFLKFARRKEIEFKKIKDVFTPDVFGFIVFEAISNGEDVLVSFRNNKSYALSMRRLHLSVSALRELIKTLAFHRERGMEAEDHEYIEQLQRGLANMTDLRQLFLWLVRTYQPGCHSNLFLRDVIVTNHYFLLLLEEWIGRQLCRDQRIDMLIHVKQFAVQGVMQRYGYLLQNFVRNDHHVNNCIFTMMHHVAGDCLKPEALLQADILKTFLQIWDTELPITQEMNDLMEYVIQKFLSTAEKNPVSCALQLFVDPTDSSEDMFIDGNDSDSPVDDDWTDEEIDKIFMWYAELDGCPNMVNQISVMFSEIGIKKSQLEIVNHMVKMGWMNSEQLEMFVDTDKQVIEMEAPKLGIDDGKQKKMISILEELAQMEEEKIIPHCVQKLQEEGFDEQLKFIQENLLEAAYVKIDGQYMDKRHVEEPSFKYYHSKGKDMPIVFYNEEQEKISSNVHMLALMQQMGLRLEEETGLTYPRIPSSMTVVELVELAGMLGKVDQEHVKFDLDTASELVSEKTEIIYSEKPIGTRIPVSSKPAAKVPGVAWMNLVANFNKTEGKSMLTRRVSLEMDTE